MVYAARRVITGVARCALDAGTGTIEENTLRNKEDI